MRLIKYKVNKFRSVKGTDWIDIDQCTCFVGLNESGKTNLLLPLWKFNPADNATKIDLLMDYPRDEYSKIDKNSKGGRKAEPFIEALFELNEDETELFNKEYEAYLDTLKKNEKNESQNIENEGQKINFSKFLLFKKDYNEGLYVHISNEKCEDLTGNISHLIGKPTFNKIYSHIPRFVYYSEYGNLDSDLYLPRVIEDMVRPDLTGKERLKVRTLKTLFGYVNLDPKEILKLGLEKDQGTQQTQEAIGQESRNKQERLVMVESAATMLSEQFQNWWSQGNYTFRFNADGKHFRILVSDNERPASIELESRSKGLQWFFSFFLVFLAESEGAHDNCVLLLDEPGLSLHPNAQNDLINFFRQLSEKNQLIYTTHLPFLVDYNNIDSVRAVYTENGLTKASNDLNKADKEKKAIQPVNAAIGITASQSLLVGCDIVIVEGVSDQFYLTMIKNHLISKGKIKPKKEMVFIPVGGAKNVKPVVSIIHGGIEKLPVVLLDSDFQGKKFQDDLKQGLYKGNQARIAETDTFTGKQGSEVEDLIPFHLIVDCFARLFYIDEENIETINEKDPIVPQLERVVKENQIDHQQGWKAELSKRVKQRFKSVVDEELETKWKELFEKLR